ncbi:MAG: hypothetical protein AB2606_04665 [Candidatus Thiodiazotropha taylori]
MVKSIKEALVIYLPVAVGIAVFGAIGMYIEIAIVQGFEAANEWLFTLRGFYPEGMLGSNGYKPIGNYLGLFVGVLWGWLLAKYVLAPRILGGQYTRKDK